MPPPGSQPTKTSRREFLQGRAALEALEGAVIGPPPPLAAPQAVEAGRAYLLSVRRDAMACEFEVLQLAGKFPGGAEAAIAALDLVERLEAQLTVYRESSELMAINRAAAREALAVEPRLFDLLVRAAALSEATGGAFDITAGPLSKVWGFHRRQGRLPDASQVAEALALVGSRLLTLNPDRRTVRFQQTEMELNLGAIGKGYALDRAAETMWAAGVSDFAIHGGNSSVIARGNRLAENPESDLDGGWSVALRHPLKPDVRLAEFRLVNQALGTSGSGTQFFHHQGKRYGHILDPRTGWPAEQALSASVVAATAEQADALSTALYVLGVDRAREFCASRPQIAALLVTAGSRAGQVELHPLNLPSSAWRLLESETSKEAP